MSFDWNLAGQRAWTLHQDAIAGNVTELWIDGVKLTQTNGSNPKITPMGMEDLILMGSSGTSEPVAGYYCRIVQDETLLPRLDFNLQWELKFPAPGDRVTVFPRGSIGNTKAIGLGWVVKLEVR